MGGQSLTFYVSQSQTTLQDISISDSQMTCSPGGSLAMQPFGIASAALATDGSFSTTRTWSGVYRGYPATFTDTFQGNFHSVSATGVARAAGSFRETMAYTDSAARTCTSNASIGRSPRT